MLDKTAERHTSAESAAFLIDIVVNQPKNEEIHVIADNLSAHRTKPRFYDTIKMRTAPVLVNRINQLCPENSVYASTVAWNVPIAVN